MLCCNTELNITYIAHCSLQTWLVGSLVFGGKDPITGFTIDKDALKHSFNKNLQAWAKVGAAPVTYKCLESKKVRCAFGDADDEVFW